MSCLTCGFGSTQVRVLLGQKPLAVKPNLFAPERNLTQLVYLFRSWFLRA